MSHKAELHKVKTRGGTLREAKKTNIRFLAALPGVLPRCSSFVWLATGRSERLALHPASALKNGILAISASLKNLSIRQPLVGLKKLAMNEETTERLRLGAGVMKMSKDMFLVQSRREFVLQ